MRNSENWNELAALIIPRDKYSKTALSTRSFLPLLNKHAIEYQIRQLLEFGFQRVIVCLYQTDFNAFERICAQYLAEIKFNFLPIDDMRVPTPSKLIQKAAFLLKTDFLVLSGDFVSDANLSEILDFHITNDSLLTAAFHLSNKRKQQNVYSNPIVGLTETKRIIFYNKIFDVDSTQSTFKIDGELLKSYGSLRLLPQMSNPGMYFASQKFLKLLKDAKENNTEKSLLEACFDGTVTISGHDKIFFYEIHPTLQSNLSSDEDFKDANFNLMSLLLANKASHWINKWISEGDFFEYVKEENKSCKFGNNCVFGEGVKLGTKCLFKKCVIGQHCVVGDNVRITNSIVFDHVCIESNVTVRNSVIKSDSKIAPNCILEGICIKERSVIIGKNQNS